jgi:exonuclease III
MCLNETKIDLKGYLALSPDLQNPFLNYYGYWNFCKIKAGYSGVAIFTKHKPITVIEDFPTMPEYSLEGRVLTLEYSRFFIICIYSPCSGLELERLAFRTQ